MPQAKRILITTHSTLLAAAAMALCIPAAHAWDYTAPAPTPTPSATITNSPMGGAGGVGGQGGTGGAGGNAHAAASARGGNAHASGGNASVAVTIDPATTATPASGAADPSTTGRRSAGDPADPSGTHHGGGHGGGRGGGGNTVINDNQAPAIALPSIGGGGGDCPVVGFGVGGSGLGGGGGFGPSWISSRCDHRKYAELLAELQGKAAALAYLCRVESDTCAAPVATSATVPISTTPAVPAIDCAAVNLAQTGHGKMSPSELAAYRECHA